MANITLKQLRYLDALARHGHFGRAAEACAISQPALSVQIKSLEAELGAALFDRGPRDLRVTNLGEQVLQRAQSILRSVEELSDFARTPHKTDWWDGCGWGLFRRLRPIFCLR